MSSGIADLHGFPLSVRPPLQLPHNCWYTPPFHPQAKSAFRLLTARIPRTINTLSIRDLIPVHGKEGHMKVLVVGGGGREHALAWKIAQSQEVHRVYCAPGNAGTAHLSKAVNVPIQPEDLPGLEQLVRVENIDLTVVGPEIPLELGLVDRFVNLDYPVFGPTRRAARLETSKSFCKQVCRKYGIPSANFAVYHDPDSAHRYLREHPGRIVVKASGLAAGKGVILCDDTAQALKAVDDIMERRLFGNAGKEIIIEEFLEGEEASVLFFTDGTNIYPLETAQDHKAVFDGDKGPNTGGMGAYSPAPVITDALQETLEREVLVPIVHAMNREGCPYRGVLYAGIMVTPKGPKVLEFNARFGDPETQPILMRLKSDLVPVMQAIIAGKLDTVELAWDTRAALCVVMASGGYPDQYEKGKTIRGLDAVAHLDDACVFHAGTTLARDGSVVTSGGRVLGVTALGDTIAAAQKRAYQIVHQISFEGAHYRTDIGYRAIARA